MRKYLESITPQRPSNKLKFSRSIGFLLASLSPIESSVTYTFLFLSFLWRCQLHDFSIASASAAWKADQISFVYVLVSYYTAYMI